MTENNVYSLGGHQYSVLAQGTLEHDHYLMTRVRASGLHHLKRDPNDTTEEHAMKVLAQVIDAGEAMALLGGLIIPVGMDPTDWRPRVAEDIAERLRRLTDPEEKAIANGLLLSALMDFFPDEPDSTKTSRTSSESGESGSQT